MDEHYVLLKELYRPSITYISIDEFRLGTHRNTANINVRYPIIRIQICSYGFGNII